MREKAAAFFRKQKKEQWMLYFLLAAIGVVLLLPTGTKKTGEETEQPQETAARCGSIGAGGDGTAPL